MSEIGYNGDAKEHLGAVLRQARKARGLRQEDVAVALDVNIKQVGRWEKGENTPSGLALMRLLKLFRERADQPDLETLIRLIEQQPSENLDERIAELGRRARNEPWLLDRLNRLLDLTNEEFQASMEYLDRCRSADRSSP